MMKRNIILLFLLPALLIAGCENPMDDHGPDAGGPTTFTATIEGGDGTKTTLGPLSGGIRPVHWSDGDAISISGATYTVSSGEGTTTATFTGSGASQTGGVYKAYYPASIYSGGSLNLPSPQDYDETNRGDKLPMYAESATTTLPFKNLCALLEFKLTGSETVGSIVVESTEGKKLSGAIASIAWSDGDPVLTMDATASNTVTLNCGTSGVTLNATTPTSFFIAVPAQEYTLGTLKVTVKKPNGDEITSFTNSAGILSALRSKIYDITKNIKAPVFTVSYNGVATSSTGTTVVVSDPIVYHFTVGENIQPTFSVETNMGYTVEVSDPSAVNGTLPSGVSTPNTTLRNAVVPIVAAAKGNWTPPASAFTEAEFSVSATNKVKFSPGNLQFRAYESGASVNKWRFAQNQWDYVGGKSGSTNYGTVYEGTVKSENTKISETYDGWIDLFGFGTSGRDYGAVCYQPWSTSSYGLDYHVTDHEVLLGDEDWGVNDIYRGADLVAGGTYRTPTNEEYQYLIDGRAGLGEYSCVRAVISTRILTVTFKAKDDSRYAVSYTIVQPTFDAEGLILFPDGFKANHDDLVATFRDKITTNRDTPATVWNWPALEAAGCVFLPVTGERAGATVWRSSRVGYYRSATRTDGINHSYTVQFSLSAGNAAAAVYSSRTNGRDYGYAVRLVKDVSFTGGNGTNSPYTPGGSGGF